MTSTITAEERAKAVEWLWYGEDEAGNSHVSFGRWRKHACQYRYKFAEIQATEHDHPLPQIPIPSEGPRP